MSLFSWPFFLFFQKVCISNKIQLTKSLSIASRLIFNCQNICVQNTMSFSRFGRRYLLWPFNKVHYIWPIWYFFSLVYFVYYFKRKLRCVKFALVNLLLWQEMIIWEFLKTHMNRKSWKSNIPMWLLTEAVWVCVCVVFMVKIWWLQTN